MKSEVMKGQKSMKITLNTMKITLKGTEYSITELFILWGLYTETTKYEKCSWFIDLNFKQVFMRILMLH